MGVIWGAGTANPSGAAWFIPGFSCGSCCSIFSFVYIQEINHGSQNVLGVLTWIGGGIKFTNIRQSMLKVKTHSGFHDLFRF
jgi:hypothetical protein